MAGGAAILRLKKREMWWARDGKDGDMPYSLCDALQMSKTKASILDEVNGDVVGGNAKPGEASGIMISDDLAEALVAGYRKAHWCWQVDGQYYFKGPLFSLLGALKVRASASPTASFFLAASACWCQGRVGAGQRSQSYVFLSSSHAHYSPAGCPPSSAAALLSE